MAWLCHVFTLFGSNRINALVPMGAIGVLSKLNWPSKTAYAESLELTLEARMRDGFGECCCMVHAVHCLLVFDLGIIIDDIGCVLV